MAQTGIQDRYTALRRQLTDLSYPELFGIDSVELIERLVRDLLNTTSSYKSVQEKEARLNADLALVQAQLFPLRRENARLTRENHELHIDSIRQNEESTHQMDDFSRQVRDLTDKINEMKMLNKVFEEQLKGKDEVIERLREAYEGVVDPALKARHSTTSSIKSTSKISRVSRVGDNTGNERSVSAVSAISGKSGKSIKSAFSKATLFNPMLETASAKIIESLRDQLDTASKKIKESEEEIGRLRSSLVAREQELSRSNRLIGNAAARSLLGDSATASGNAATSQVLSSPIDPQVIDASNKRIIDQLNSQVDFLNEQLAFREAQLANLHGHLQEAEVLKTDLAVSSATLDRFRDDNQKLQSRIHHLEQKLVSLGGANTPLRTPSRDLRREPSIEAKESAFSPMRKLDDMQAVAYEDMIKGLKAEKQQLEKEVQLLQSKLIDNPPTTSSLRKSPGTTQAAAKSKTSPVDGNLVADLNRDVETLRKKNMALEKQVHDLEAKLTFVQSKQSSTPVHSRTAFGAGSQEPSVLFGQLKEKEHTIHELQFHKDKLQTMFDAADEALRSLQEKHQILNHDYEHLQEAFHKQEEEFEQNQKVLSQMTFSYDALKTDLVQLSNEKSQLQVDLSKVRKILAESESNRRLESMTGRDGRAHEEEGTPAPNTYIGHNTKYDELFHENDGLRRQVMHLQSELTLCQDRFQVLQGQLEEHQARQDFFENGNAQTGGNGQSIASSYKKQLEELTREKRSLVEELSQMMSLKEQLSLKCNIQTHNLEEEKSKKKVAEFQVISIQKECDEITFKYNQVKDLLTRVETNYDITQSKLSSCEEMIKKLTTDRNHILDESLRYTNQLQEKDLAIASLKEVIQTLDTERDKLQDAIESLEDQVHLKTTENRTLTEQLQAIRNMVIGHEKTIQNKQQELNQVQKIVQDLDGKNNALQMERSELIKALQEKGRREGTMSEDLLLMTKENQALSSELSKVCSDRDQLSLQVRELIQQLQYSESNKHGMEVEKQDLLDNYRLVIKERRRVEDELKSLTVMHNDKSAVLKRFEKDNLELQSKIQAYVNIEERWGIEKSALNNHIELMTDSVQDMQRKVESIEADNRKMVQDSHALKQSNAMLNERLTIVMKRAAASAEANKVLTSRLGSVEKERDAMRAIVEIERQRAADMMKVAEVARIDAATKDIHLQRLKTELNERLDGNLISPSRSSPVHAPQEGSV